MTMQGHTLRCRCGLVTGRVDADLGQSGCCYCDDCRAFARAIGRDDTLDAAGGTLLYQTTPSRLHLDDGALAHVTCLRLSDKGMFRFHTRCCQTPIGNTMANPKMAFIGIPRAALDGSDGDYPPVMRIQGRFATQTPPAGTADVVTPSQAVATMWFLLRATLGRGHRPHPFFDDGGQPRVPVRVLSTTEREALRSLDVRPA